jgi:hypothetical protein
MLVLAAYHPLSVQGCTQVSDAIQSIPALGEIGKLTPQASRARRGHGRDDRKRGDTEIDKPGAAQWCNHIVGAMLNIWDRILTFGTKQCIIVRREV